MKSFKAYIIEGQEAELIGLLKAFGAGAIDLQPTYLSTTLRKKQQVWEIVSRLPSWTDYDVFVYELNPATAGKHLENPDGINNSAEPYEEDDDSYTIDEIGYEDATDQFHEYVLIVYLYNAEISDGELEVPMGSEVPVSEAVEPKVKKDPKTIAIELLKLYGKDPIYKALILAIASGKKADAEKARATLVSIRGPQALKNVQASYRKLVSEETTSKKKKAQYFQTIEVANAMNEGGMNLSDALRSVLTKVKYGGGPQTSDILRDLEANFPNLYSKAMGVSEEYKKKEKEKKKKSDDIEAAEADQADSGNDTAGTDAEYEAFIPDGTQIIEDVDYDEYFDDRIYESIDIEKDNDKITINATDALTLTEEVIADYEKRGYTILERRRVIRVSARGQRKVKIKCGKGYKYQNNKCIKITGKEASEKRLAIRKAVRTKKAKGSGYTKRVQRLRKRALKKRKSMGLNAGFDIQAEMPKTHSIINADFHMSGKIID